MNIDTFSGLPLHEQSRIIEMAWEDGTPFEAIELQFGFGEKKVVQITQHQLKLSSFRNWPVRVSGRPTKNTAFRAPNGLRGYCKNRYKIRQNKKK
jgi:uncharacterized protein (TIGR03643 family)